MTSPAITQNHAAAIPVPVASPRELAPYALFVGVISLLLVYFVGAEQGATHVFAGMQIHEFVHDGRHLLGFPCH